MSARKFITSPGCPIWTLPIILTSPYMSTSLCISVALHTHSSASHVAAVGDGAGASPITTCSWNMAVPLTSMMSVSSFPSSVFAWNCTFDSKLAVALAMTSSPARNRAIRSDLCRFMRITKSGSRLDVFPMAFIPSPSNTRSTSRKRSAAMMDSAADIFEVRASAGITVVVKI